FRGPLSGRRIRSRRSVARRSFRPGAGEMTPPVRRVIRPGRTRVALTFCRRAVEVCRFLSVGRESDGTSASEGRGRRWPAGCEAGAVFADGDDRAEGADGAEGAEVPDGAETADVADAADAPEAAEEVDAAAGGF